jgi:ABC-type Fe3+ transport system substrate-binding protein
VEPLRAQGLPLQPIYLDDWKGFITSGSGLLAVYKPAPHPNAATVFVNWFASAEGQKAVGTPFTLFSWRTDVTNDWMPDYVKPQPGVEYPDDYDWNFQLQVRGPVLDKVKAALTR